MNRTLHCANVRALGNAHSHITPESVTTACTLPAQNSLKAAASAVLARTLPRTLPAQSRKTACTLPAQNTPECAPIVQSISADLDALIQRAGTFWMYSPDDYELIRQVARTDPDGLRLALENDIAFRPMTETRPNESNPSIFGDTDMLTVSAEQSGTFELPPAGAVAARCCRLLDLGSQAGEYQGKPTLKRKLLLSWELAELRADGTPFQISRRFTLSLAEKSALRAFLEAWRGRAFSPDELAGFDLTKLLKAPCLLNIATVERAGKDYANILSISPLPKGMTAPDLAAPAIAFDIDADNAADVLETLSDGLQATITASPEWKSRLKAMTTAPAAGGFAADLDDDIVF